MNAYDLQFLHYVRNTNGGATVGNFVEDWEPIGQQVWDGLLKRALVRVDAAGRIALTELGARELG